PIVTNSEGTLTSVLNQLMIFNGPISGAGSIHYTGAVTEVFEMNGNNSYSGATQIFEGLVSINGDSGFGNGGQVDFDSSAPGGVFLRGNWTTSRPISVNFSQHINTNGFNFTMNGRLMSSSSPTKLGLGDFIITTPAPYTGSMTVSGGNLVLRGTGAITTGLQTINAGAGLILDDSGTHFSDRIADNAG